MEVIRFTDGPTRCEVWELPDAGWIRVHVVNGGQDPVTIHQVAIDDAIWAFSIHPGPTIDRLGRATIEIPYPWVEGETHEVRLVSRNGITFDAPIEVATRTPSATPGCSGGWPCWASTWASSRSPSGWRRIPFCAPSAGAGSTSSWR